MDRFVAESRACRLRAVRGQPPPASRSVRRRPPPRKIDALWAAFMSRNSRPAPPKRERRSSYCCPPSSRSTALPRRSPSAVSVATTSPRTLNCRRSSRPNSELSRAEASMTRGAYVCRLLTESSLPWSVSIPARAGGAPRQVRFGSWRWYIPARAGPRFASGSESTRNRFHSCARGGNQGRPDNLLDALGGSFPPRVGGSLNPVRRGGGCLLLVVAAVLVEVLHDVAPQLFHLGVGRFLRRADFRS